MNTRVYFLFYNTIVDAYSAAPPFLLYIFSTPFRACFHELYTLEFEHISTFIPASFQLYSSLYDHSHIDCLQQRTVSIHISQYSTTTAA